MELKYLDKFKCYQIFTDFGGLPWRVADGWMGWGWVWICGGCPMHTHMHMTTHTHMHTCMHACTCMLNMINMLNMDAFMLVAICNFYTCIHVCACMCMHVGIHPYAPRHLPPTCPIPRAAGSPKHQNSISPELIEIIRFCLKILYL